mgnify:CR=1 FL=1
MIFCFPHYPSTVEAVVAILGCIDRASALGVGGATPKGFEVAGFIHHMGLAFGAVVRVVVENRVEYFGSECGERAIGELCAIDHRYVMFPGKLGGGLCPLLHSIDRYP